MQRLVFTALLVANLAFAGFIYSEERHPDTTRGDLLSLELKADQVRLVDSSLSVGTVAVAMAEPPMPPLPAAPPQPQTPPPVEVPGTPAPVESASPLIPAPPAAPTVVAEAPPAVSLQNMKTDPIPTAGPKACMEWGGFALADSQKAYAHIEASGLPVTTTQRKVPDLYVVYIAGIPSRAEADQLAGQLKAAREADFAITADGRQFRIALGVFRVEAGAQQRVARIQGLGIKGVVMEPRGERVSTRYLIQAAESDPRMKPIFSAAGKIAGSQISVVPCP